MVKLQVWLELAPEYSRQGHLFLCIHLSKIFKTNLATGYVPKSWKIKRVSPIHKGDVKTDPSNFRPISILLIPNEYL